MIFFGKTSRLYAVVFFCQIDKKMQKTYIFSQDEEVKRVLKIGLKALRINAGYTQQSLADKLGVSAATISRWERKKIKIPKEKFEEICVLGNISVDSIEQDNIKIRKGGSRNWNRRGRRCQKQGHRLGVILCSFFLPPLQVSG